MKRCPQCNRVETDEGLKFCRLDGATLVDESSPIGSESATAQLGSVVANEVHASILPYNTSANVNPAVAQTTVLPQPPVTSTTHELAKPKRRTTAIVAIAIAVVGIISAVVVISYLSRKGDTSIESIAIMPFQNQSNDPNSDYLSDGITENIINSLSQLPNLKVMARTTVFRYKGRDADAQKVGEELGVATVLTGKVLKQGDTLQIQADLVRVSDGSEIWGNRYSRKLADVFVMQSDLAKEISDRLRIQLSGVERERMAKHATENTEAYELYLKGRYHYFKGTESDMRQASNYYQQAIDKDPNFARAYVGLADSYGTASTYLLPPNQAYAKVKDAALRALQIDDGLSEAHATWGTYKFFYERDWRGAEAEFKRAIALNPNSPDAATWYSFYLGAMQRFDEAIAQATRAKQLDPLSIVANVGVAESYYQSRQYDLAIDAFRKCLELDPQNVYAHELLGVAYQKKGMQAQAIAEFEKAVQIDSSPGVISFLGWGYGAAGRADDARKVLSQLEQIGKQRYVSPYNNALVFAGLGDQDHTFEWLNKADEERNDFLVYLKCEPVFDSVRSDPRFNEFIRRIGLTP